MIITTDTWHKEHGETDYITRRDQDQDGVLLKGMIHAFNCVKHNMSFFQIHQKDGGFSFPISFPLAADPITVHWMPAGEILKGDYENQKKNYVKYIEGKEILDTFNQVLTFLNKEFTLITFNK